MSRGSGLLVFLRRVRLCTRHENQSKRADEKTVAMAAGAALVVGGLGACWYTGNAADRILGSEIARAKQEERVDHSIPTKGEPVHP